MRIVKFTGGIDEQSQLTERLHNASVAYYGGKTPLMTDIQFDKELEELKEMEHKNGFAYDISPSMLVGATSVDELRKSEHEQPALSLDKVKYKDREKLTEWLGNHDGILSWKMDGLTVVVTYDKGELRKAVTRGNGTVGSDITHNAIFFHGLPLNIPYSGHLVVRGECTMTTEEFSRVNEEAGDIYENPRNLASATIQMLDSKESRKRKIDFTAFEMVQPNDCTSMSHRFVLLKEFGFNVVEHWMVNKDNILDVIELCKLQVDKNPFPTDGLVLTYEDQKFAASLGNTGHHPRGAIAMKWTDETARTVVRKIEWSVGKTGVITPIAIFDTVRLGLGSNVSRASLHNLSVMNGLGIGVGSKADVYLANMIIPNVAYATPGEVEIPKVCPVCGSPTEVVDNDGIMTLHCTNKDCSARKIKMLVTFVSKDGMDIQGLSENKIGSLINHGYIDDPLDFYLMNQMSPKERKRLENIDGWGKKSVAVLLAAIEISRDTDLQHFIYALSIPLCGHDLSKRLSKIFEGDPQKFLEFAKSGGVSVDLSNYDGFGPIKAESIRNWCENTDVIELESLINNLRFKQKSTNTGENNMEGLTFVITGSVHHFKNRDEFKAYVEEHGGKVSGSVSAKTSYLVNNDIESTSGKNKKAKELGVPIISEDQFVEMFG